MLIYFCLFSIISNVNKQPHVRSWLAFPYFDYLLQGASSSDERDKHHIIHARILSHPSCCTKHEHR